MVQMLQTDTSDWLFDEHDRASMRIALEQARLAAERDEVPVGAVITNGGTIIAQAGNQRQTIHDPSAHAEILVLRRAGEKLHDWRLETSTLYVTLEPCPMCIAACRQARLALVIWGATDPVMGACGARIDLAEDQRLGPPLAHRGGLYAEESREILTSFFAKKRKSS